MCDSTLLLIKEKIIHTDAIIKLLSDKNTQINQLKRQLKFLYKTYLAKTKELEICNLKETTNPSYINEKILLEKYTKLEAIHQDYVNVSTIKYQNICKELEESKSSKAITNIKTIKKCNKCKEEVENNRVLKRQITHLKQNIVQLTNKVESKNKNNLKDFKYSPEYKQLKRNHDTEIESLMSEHMMELDKMETKFKGEINNYQDKIISLEAQHMIYKDKIDELKLELNETKILVLEKNTVKSESKISNEIKGGLYELLSDCDLEAPKDDLRTKLDQSSQTDEISFYHISNDINQHENVDIVSLFGDEISDVLNDHQEDFVELSNLDDNELIGAPLKCLEEVKEDLNDGNLDVWRCIQEMKEIPEPLSSMSSSENEEETTTSKKNNEKETTTSRKNNVFNKRLKLKRLAQENRRKFITNMKKDLFKSIVKYVGKMIKSNDRENKSKKMSKQFKNKRKLEMLRWTALREISSTDSDVSSTSKSKIKMRKLKYKHLKVNNKEEYDKFCEKLNTMTTFYNSLSADENKIEGNSNVGEESGQDSGFGKSDIECGRINKCGDEEKIIQSIKMFEHDKLIEHQIDKIENNLAKNSDEIEFLQNYDSNKSFEQGSSSENDNLSSNTKVCSDLIEITSLESSENELFENKKEFSQNYNSNKSLSSDTKVSDDSLEIASFRESSQNDSLGNKIEFSQNYNFNKLIGHDSSSENGNFNTHRKVSDDLLEITPFKEASQSDSFENNDDLSSHTKVSSDSLEICPLKETSQSDSIENKIESSQNENLSSHTKVSSDLLEITPFKETSQSYSFENDSLSSHTKVSDDSLQITSFKELSQSDSFESKIKFSENENLSSQIIVSSDLLEITPFKETSQSDLFENNSDGVYIKKSETFVNDLINKTSPSETNTPQSDDNCVTNSFKKENGRRCSPRINKLKRQQNKNWTKEINETKQLTNSILDLIPICEPTKPSISSNNEVSDTPQNNSDESNKLELANSKFPSELNENDVPVRPVKRRKANLKRTIDVSDRKITSNGEPSNKLKKGKNGCVKRSEHDSVIKEVIKVERKTKLEKTCFKRPVKRKLCTPMSPPHSADCEFAPPKIIPLNAGQLHAGVGKKLLKKLIQFPGESVILQDIIDKFSSQKQNYVIRLIIEEVLIDTSKSDNKFTPPAPILTPVQRTLLGLTIKLQESFPDILTEILFSLEHSILSETGLNKLISLARFYTGICKLKKELHRMRRMIGDVFFVLNDLAIPFLYTVLSTWTEILPLEAESHDNMLVKVLIQIINMKNCEPGYCLTTLKGLLQNYYGYPKERWKSEDVFNETFIKFKENPSKFLEFALLILFKNHPNKWVFEQMEAHLKPLLNNSTDNHIKKAIVVLISNTLLQFGSDNCQYVQEIETWLKNLNSVM